MTLLINNDGYAILVKLDLMFSIIMEKVPVVTNFKRSIYQTLN